jgi:hypothetical protein
MCLTLFSGACEKQSEIIAQNGGSYWSTVAKGTGPGDQEITGGSRFWIWPASESKPIVKNGKLVMPFKWSLRSGQKPPGLHGEDDIVIEFRLLPEGKVTIQKDDRGGSWAGGGIRANLAQDTTKGDFDLRYDLKESKVAGDAWLLMYLVGNAPTPTSNILRVNVSFE